jgi:hypothetical protein
LDLKKGSGLFLSLKGFKKGVRSLFIAQRSAAKLSPEIPASATSVAGFGSMQFWGKKMMGKKNTGHLFAPSFFCPITLSFDDES